MLPDGERVNPSTHPDAFAACVALAATFHLSSEVFMAGLPPFTWNVQRPPICTMDFPNCCSGGATFTACMLAQKVYIVRVFYSYTNTLHAVTSLCVCMWVGVCVCACRYHLTHECTWNTWKFCIFFPFCFCQMAEFPASRGVEPFLGAALDQPWGCGKWKYGCCLLQHLQPIPRRWI